MDWRCTPSEYEIYIQDFQLQRLMFRTNLYTLQLDYIWPVESIFQGFQILGLRFQGQKNSELQEGYSYNLVLWCMCV